LKFLEERVGGERLRVRHIPRGEFAI
jgi:hypothetical protein